MSSGNLYAGLDFGTSGARVVVIDTLENVVHTKKVAYLEDQTEPKLRVCNSWKNALFELLQGMPPDLCPRVKGICIDGTSSSSLLVNRETWEILSRPLMYNYTASSSVVDKIREIAPANHITTSSSSTLAKLFTWIYEDNVEIDEKKLLLHQADWLASLLQDSASKNGITDYNNVLKLGYDPQENDYPSWMKTQAFFEMLPKSIVAPSTPIGSISSQIAKVYGFPENCQIIAGTTDSIAAFLASGASKPGEGVTSLGSTLAIKVLSTNRIDDVKYGIYSHKLNDELWLAGGASNSGGAVLRKFFSDAELEELSKQIDLKNPTNLNYYPLPSVGERFPIADANLSPKLEPVPSNRSQFLQAIFEGITDIERMGYTLLEDLGCTQIKRVITAGGGAQNDTWIEMRRTALGVPVSAARNVEAAHGSALLALRSQI